MAPVPPEQPVGVVGAGTMGAGVAQVAAAAGHPVTLFDLREDAPKAAVDRIDGALGHLVNKGRMDKDDRAALIDRIRPADTLETLADCALVVEAVAEDLTVKRGVFADLERITGPGTILATNTSSLSITAIGAGLNDPGRLVGMHFFNPVPRMPLVEVISGLRTRREVADTVFSTALAWGKQPVHARSTPGFIVNRVARPFYAEALRVLQEQGTDVVTLDAIVREAGGFRMGPLELTDLIGQDVNYAVTCAVYDAFYQDPRFTPSIVQRELVSGGLLGRKSGRGFYEYGEHAGTSEPNTEPPREPPRTLTVTGNPAPLRGWWQRLADQGIEVRHEPGEPPHLRLDDTVRVALTDGRTATQRTADEPGPPWVLLDLALNFDDAPRLAIAAGDQAGDSQVGLLTGLLQCLGKAVSRIDDIPGLIVMRTVCMLANEAADAVNQGVCSAEAVDLAMRRGVNYPMGPLGWADAIGPRTVVGVLDNLARTYGDGRYRVSPRLRRAVATGDTLL